jgi:hypothetical protein
MSGFKMSRRLRMLMVGILAVAIANSLQASLATDESNKNRQECVSTVTKEIEALEIPETVEVLIGTSRNYRPTMPEPSKKDNREEYEKKVQSDCEKLFAESLGLDRIPCLKDLSDDGESMDALEFLKEMGQVSQKAQDVLDAQKECAYVILYV